MSFNVEVTASGQTQVVSGVSGKRLQLFEINIQNLESIDTTITLLTASRTILGPLEIAAGQLFSVGDADSSVPYDELDDGESLVISQTVVADLTVFGKVKHRE